MAARQRKSNSKQAKILPSDEKNIDGKKASPSPSAMKSMLGFDLKDLMSYNRFVQLCHAPTDPSSLAIFRITFGALMVCDSMEERGGAHIVSRWSDMFQVCRFPLFNSLQPLPVEWMAILYVLMTAGAAGIAIGFLYRLSCLMFVLPYWYIFFLDKTVWNNHSYLFGITATLLLFTDANRQWSIDSWRKGDKSNTRVPAWHYGILRFQYVIVYFVAGLKKLDRDWVQGYSMSSLSHAWVFDPFRYILSEEQIDQYIVHWGGLLLDLTGGFLLYLDDTRWLGTAMVSSFHLMNATMFAIGQFPYVMLCSNLIFYAYDWPRKLCTSQSTSATTSHLRSKHCLYDKEKPGIYHHIFSVFTIIFMLCQLVLPYSHWLTKGYNHWTGGMYGYSWDMMVHNWDTQHIKIKYRSKTTGQEGYLQPNAFVSTDRWSGYPDMVKQHAVCIAELLYEEYQVPDAEVYMDIWHSMNQRFQQRFVDPTVDLVRVEWSPFRKTSFLLPLLNDLEGWRDKLKVLSNQAREQTDIDWFLNSPDVAFVADFPGMVLENFIHEDLQNTNITLLAGSAILYNTRTKKNTTLELNKAVPVGIGTHKVYVTSDIAACYMYMYMNSTSSALESQLTQLNLQISQQGFNLDELEEKAKKNETLRRMLDLKNARDRKLSQNVDIYERMYRLFKTVQTSLITSYVAIESIIRGEPMEDLLETRLGISIDTL